MAPRGAANASAGSYFAWLVELEDLSAVAYHRLARELAQHGAPVRLVRSARAAAFDEMRHARAMAKLARARGAELARAVALELPTRSLEAMALDNALEGCVRVTWGAAICAWAAEHARDEITRGELARIAKDEAEHAALAWKIMSWAEPRMMPRERDRMQRAMRAMIGALAAEAAREPAREALDEGLLPPAHVAAAMFSELRASVWKDAGDYLRRAA